MRNFNREGSSNLRTSSFTDHAKTEMHQRAMLLLKKEHRLIFVCGIIPFISLFCSTTLSGHFDKKSSTAINNYSVHTPNTIMVNFIVHVFLGIIDNTAA